MEWLERVREIAERVAISEGLELVDVEFLGRGPNAVLRIYLDKPGGINISDCQAVSGQVGTILDVEEVIDQSYTLEVSSPGLDRKLLKPADYQRFAGKPVKLVLKGPRQGPRRYKGLLVGIVPGIGGEEVRVDTGDGQVVQVGYDEIEKANLVVEFGPPAKDRKKSKKSKNSKSDRNKKKAAPETDSR
jgi:ribosome maturation factor RimP